MMPLSSHDTKVSRGALAPGSAKQTGKYLCTGSASAPNADIVCNCGTGRASGTRTKIPRVLLMITALSAFIIVGCGKNSESKSESVVPEDALHTEIERGPVKVEVSLVPKEPRLSDEPTLTVTITAEDKVDVEKVPFGTSLGDFVIRDFYEPLPKTADGRQVLQQIYTLEAVQPGRLNIDPIPVTFVDSRPDGDGQEHTVETEALIVNVGTMIESEAPSLTDLRPAEDPVELPGTTSPLLFGGIIGGLLALLVVAAFFWRRKRKSGPLEPELTPQQLAWRELQDLLGSKLQETDVKEYFVQLTAVVRRYIERSTGVRAPEQTTEEFLREVNQREMFSNEENHRLGVFLESADLVKFAGYQPDEESIKDSTQKARQFIELKSQIVADDAPAESEVSA